MKSDVFRKKENWVIIENDFGRYVISNPFSNHFFGKQLIKFVWETQFPQQQKMFTESIFIKRAVDSPYWIDRLLLGYFFFLKLICPNDASISRTPCEAIKSPKSSNAQLSQ